MRQPRAGDATDNVLLQQSLKRNCIGNLEEDKTFGSFFAGQSERRLEYRQDPALVGSCLPVMAAPIPGSDRPTVGPRAAPSARWPLRPKAMRAGHCRAWPAKRIMLTVRAGETDEQILRGIRPLGVTRQRVAVAIRRALLTVCGCPLNVQVRYSACNHCRHPNRPGWGYIAIRGVLLIFSGLKISEGSAH